MKKLFLILLSAFLLVGCSKPVEQYKTTFYDTFDTQVLYMEYADSEAKFKEHAKFVEDEFKRLHKLYDNYREYEGVKNVMTVNSMAGKEKVVVDKDLYDLVKYSKENYDKTLGKVNIAMGSVLKIWHDVREANEGVEDDKTILPDSAKLEEANKHTDINQIELNDAEKSIFIKDANVQLDLGATAKGYATDLVARKLEEKGIKMASINAGGNVRTVGNKPDGKEWAIALQNPDLSSSEHLEIVYLNGSESVVTSGDYQRFFMHNGVRYHHIIDPATLQPKSLYRSVAIVTKDSGLADMLSTALYLSTKEEAEKILANFKDQVGVVWATDDQVISTDNIKGDLGSNRK